MSSGTLPPNVVARTFIDNMAPAYSAADIVVCRAGGERLPNSAMWGVRRCLCRCPRNLLNNEQLFNARAVERAGAGITVDNNDVGARFMPLLEDVGIPNGLPL